jgi:S-adenosylmethionine:tRNA ribosyltransferase-isomerase
MTPLATDLFDYDLPEDRIAQTPAERRDGSRLLVVDRRTRALSHAQFSDLPKYLEAGDTLFRNNAAVLPARLTGRRPTGARVECFLLRALPAQAGEVWECLLKPGRRLPVGSRFSGDDGSFTAEVISRDDEGLTHVRFTVQGGGTVTETANRIGRIPLPPYIRRAHPDPEDSAKTPSVVRMPDRPAGPPTGEAAEPSDRERYQTVYADRNRQVAVAAPTAGLHFTPELLATLATRGIGTADITLHVGLGTFQPMKTADVASHAIHREAYEIPVATQRALFPPRTGRRIAVGTTSVRTIEAFLGRFTAPLEASHRDEASIFIYPPASFRGVDALITNFHQPRSTLLCLVAAFLTPGSTDGIAWMKEIYAEAIAQEYRFLSYGDAMLIL